jgi:hypothetical protein
MQSRQIDGWSRVVGKRPLSTFRFQVLVTGEPPTEVLPVSLPVLLPILDLPESYSILLQNELIRWIDAIIVILDPSWSYVIAHDLKGT